MDYRKDDGKENQCCALEEIQNSKKNWIRNRKTPKLSCKTKEKKKRKKKQHLRLRSVKWQRRKGLSFGASESGATLRSPKTIIRKVPAHTTTPYASPFSPFLHVYCTASISYSSLDAWPFNRNTQIIIIIIIQINNLFSFVLLLKFINLKIK